MHVYCLHVINIKETFLQVFYQVSPLHNVLLWKCTVSLCSILLKSHCSQHSELCSDPACSKYKVKAGARERGRAHECRMQIVAPESRPQAGADLATGPRKSSLLLVEISQSPVDSFMLFIISTAPQLYKWIFPALASHAAHAANTGAVYSYL